MDTTSTALVLGGGGSKGAIQAGFLAAVEEREVKIDRIVAASVGAVNGAFFAAGVPGHRMMREWSRLRRRDIFAFNWNLLWKPARAWSLYSNKRLRKFLSDRLPTRRIEDLRIPLSIVTTDLSTGKSYFWEKGDLVEAILASCALPGVLPPVRGTDGRLQIDGALSDNVPIAAAFDRGADRVLGILCRTCAACEPRQQGLRTILGQAFGIAVDCKWRLDAARYTDRPDVLIIEPDLGERVASLDFSHGKQLAEAGYRISREGLSSALGPGDEQREVVTGEDPDPALAKVGQ